jgi:tetratricopeptide (TPR) repeat protein
VEVLADRSPDGWFSKISAVNPTYGEGYALVGYHLILNRRYEDGVAYYRKAIETDPKLWAARSQLGINLMRLGQEEEPLRQLEMSYNNGQRDAATVNSLRLLDSYKKFVIFQDDTTILKLRKDEAELLRPYFEAELHKASARSWRWIVHRGANRVISTGAPHCGTRWTMCTFCRRRTIVYRGGLPRVWRCMRRVRRRRSGVTG